MTEQEAIEAACQAVLARLVELCWDVEGQVREELHIAIQDAAAPVLIRYGQERGARDQKILNEIYGPHRVSEAYSQGREDAAQAIEDYGEQSLSLAQWQRVAAILARGTSGQESEQ